MNDYVYRLLSQHETKLFPQLWCGFACLILLENILFVHPRKGIFSCVSLFIPVFFDYINILRLFIFCCVLLSSSATSCMLYHVLNPSFFSLLFPTFPRSIFFNISNISSTSLFLFRVHLITGTPAHSGKCEWSTLI